MAVLLCGADWRNEPAFAAWAVAVERAAGSPVEASEWRRAVAEASDPSRLGEALCRLLARGEAGILVGIEDPPRTPPAEIDAFGQLAPSLRLAIAERLAAAERYDEVLRWTEGVEPSATYSPALVCYLRAVAFRMVVEDKKSSQELDRLEAWVGDSVGQTLGPARGWMVVALRRELQDGEKPLPTLARRMGDVERRLAQSEAGDATTQRQQRIVDELDKLIKRLEEERKKQQQAAAAGGGAGGAPTNPAEESRPSELKGPGEVDRKRLFAGDAWGALPPAERERLSQALQRDLPPQHRTLVEDYFRTLAEETGSADDAAMSDEGGTP